MSEYDHDAFDALRRLDGPAGLGDGAEDRIEAEMLARFDERAASGRTAAEQSVVELITETERQSRRSNRMRIALVSAAATVAVIAGVVLFTGRDQPTEPTDEPEPTTTAVTDEALVARQLEVFCTQFLTPAREADAGWVPTGVGSEARALMIMAVEQAADAAGLVEPPLADQWGDFDERLLEAAIDARLVTSLGESDGDAAVETARDLLFAVGDVVTVGPVPAGCLPPSERS